MPVPIYFSEYRVLYYVGPFNAKQFKNSLNLRCVCTNTTEILLPNSVLLIRGRSFGYFYIMCALGCIQKVYIEETPDSSILCSQQTCWWVFAYFSDPSSLGAMERYITRFAILPVCASLICPSAISIDEYNVPVPKFRSITPFPDVCFQPTTEKINTGNSYFGTLYARK